MNRRHMLKITGHGLSAAPAMGYRRPPNTHSHAILSSEDFYPTLLDMLGIDPKPDQLFDGVSQAPAFLREENPRKILFSYFPHYDGSKSRTPSIRVRHEDWKLIRYFHDRADQSHRYELYNLKEDISETRDAASRFPEVLDRLDKMIDRFLAETKCIIPKPNRTCDPDAWLSKRG